MLLESLAKLAESDGLMDDQDYGPSPLHWSILLAKDGRFLGAAPYTTEKNGKVFPGKIEIIPNRLRRGAAIEPQLFYDNTGYLFGTVIDTKKSSQTHGQWLLTDDKLLASITAHEAALAATGDEGLKAIVGFLKSRGSQPDRTVDIPVEATAGQWFAFSLEGDTDGQLVCHRPAVRKWLAHQRTARVDEKPTAFCVVTGELVTPLEHNPETLKLPGGNASGASLISFEEEPYKSFGWMGNDNAPIGRYTNQAIHRAVRRLVSPSYPDPKVAGQMLPRRSIKISDNTVVAFWTDDAANPFADSFFEMMSAPNPDPSEVARMLAAPHKGRLPILEDPSNFFAVTLSGAQGRAVVKDWFVTSVATMAGNMGRYFDSLVLPFPFDKPPIPSVQNLLRSITLYGKDENITPGLAASMYLAVIHGRPLPPVILANAVARCRMEGPTPKKVKGFKGDSFRRSHLRMQVIKVALSGLHCSKSTKFTEAEVAPMLNETIETPGYLLGRLLAVLDNIQNASSERDVNVSVTDKFYTPASTYPKQVFPKLLQLSNHHYAKLRRKKVGLSVVMDKLKISIISKLTAGFPSTLSIEDQGMFAIGYYQQRQSFFTPKQSEQEAVA
jgi:CRISPR-associated protein Csd1